jgi:hypothetical protein
MDPFSGQPNRSQSRDAICTSGTIPFSANSRIKATPVPEGDRAVVRAHDAEIHELCQDTNLALQEIRHGIANVLLDTLSLDIWTLAQILDERPSAVRDLMSGETDWLTTETMIEILEKLRP